MHLYDCRRPGLIFAAGLFLAAGLTGGQAQAEGDPAAATPAGIVTRPGHLGRQVGDIERIIHFYHDLLGLPLRGERETARPFWSSAPLIEFIDAPPHAEFRAVILPIPGTAAAPGQDGEMTIEAIEYRNIERHQYDPALHDIGISWLRLLLRDLGSVFARLQSAGTPVITSGRQPLEIEHLSGLAGRGRAVIVRDPDGYPVELVEPEEPPGSTAAADSNITGAQIVVVVADLDRSMEFYRYMLGPDLQVQSGPTYITDPDLNMLRNTPGARTRSSRLVIPGSPVKMEFIQYDNIGTGRVVRPRFQDIGIGHMLFMVDDMAAVMNRIRSAGLPILARSNQPVNLNPQVSAVFTRDPDGLFVEFMERRQ